MAFFLGPYSFVLIVHVFLGFFSFVFIVSVCHLRVLVDRFYRLSLGRVLVVCLGCSVVSNRVVLISFIWLSSSLMSNGHFCFVIDIVVSV